MSSCISICVSTVKIDSFYKYAMAMLQSLKENSNLDIPIIIHYDNMSEKQRDDLKKINGNISEFAPIPVEKYKRLNKNSGGWFVMEGWSLKNYDRVIIMDSDFICQDDISFLDTIDLDIAMISEGTGIYNAGLVVASGKLLNEGWYEKMLECDHTKIKIGGNRDKWSKDQKLINYFLGPRICPLDRNYNWLIDSGAAKAKMIHYIYKPLYEVGRKQLMENDPKLVTIWESYYSRALKVVLSAA